MGNMINIGGRIHNPEVGNVVTGANEILDDTKGKKQNVINQETDAALLNLSQTKQDNLTFDNVPTENSNNPVKSSGVYAADAALQSAIEAILLLIPSAATALNQLADKAFVNSSIATNTATFRGTYNSVSDLHLAIDATHAQIEAALDSTIATADNNDYCYVQIPVSATSFDIEKTERYKFNGTNWAFEYQLNNSGFTAAQWAALNSGITAALVDDIGVIKGLIPAEATTLNQLADKAYVVTQIIANIPAFKGQFTALTYLQAVQSKKAGDLGIVRTTDSDGYPVFTFYQYLNNQWNVFYTLAHHNQKKPATTGTTGDYPYNGMGRVVLEKNLVGGVPTLTQDMFKKGPVGSRVDNENTIFVIQYDFVLGENITIPTNCVLEFDGGSITTNGSTIKLSSGSKVYGGTIYTNGVSVFDITNCTDIVIDRVKCTNTIDARCFLVTATNTGNAHNIIVKNCSCNNIGIIYNDGTFNVSATYNSNFYVLNNVCTIASSFGNRPDGIFLCFCEHFIVDSNRLFNTRQGITIWGGDGVNYPAWFDNTTQTVNFGTSEGIITNNEMETIGDSDIFIALGIDILVSNNIVKGQDHEALDAEFSKDITFDNNIVYSNDPFAIFGYRDNIVYSNNKVYLPDNFSGEAAYMIHIEPCTTGQHYGEYNDIMGKCYIRDNFIDSNDNTVRLMSLSNLSFECVGNYIKNSYVGDPDIGIEQTYLNNTFKYTRGRTSNSYSVFRTSNSGKFVFENNKIISNVNDYLASGIIVMEQNSNAIVKNNYIDLLFPFTLFITYNVSNICKVVFEDNILSSRFREGNGGELTVVSGVGDSSTFVTFYKHNIWEDNLKDIMFEDTNLTFYNRTKQYTTFAQGTILPKNEVSGSSVIVSKYCIADGTLSSSGNWKDIIL